MNDLSHNLAADVVIIQDGEILLVRDELGWCLPKGSPEIGEQLYQTAIREAKEETGFNVTVSDVACITEYRTKEWGQYLQVYYNARIDGGVAGAIDSAEISDIRFVPLDRVRELIKYQAWIVPLETWFRERRTAYHFFDLDVEGTEI